MDVQREEEIQNAVANFSIPKATAIDIQLFSKRNNRVTQLVYGSGGAASVKGQNKSYNFELEDDVYILNVDVQTEGYASYDEATFEYTDLNGRNKVERVRNSGEGFSFPVNSFIKSFSFKPDKKYLKEPRIKLVTFFGYTKGEFHSVCESISNFDEYKSEVSGLIQKALDRIRQTEAKKEKIESEVSDAEAGLSERHSELKQIKDEIKEYLDVLNKTKENIDDLKSKENAISAKLEQSEDLLDKNRKEQKYLNDELAEKTSKLRQLKEDINLFPSEISSFVAQGARSISRYTLLSFLPVSLILAVTYALFSNAADLTVIYKDPDGVSIWAVFLTRLPYVLISITIVHACYKIAKVFISEIIKINQQRLNLSKISIIATDVSKASAESLDMTDDELYQYRTQLKMELLREHLKEYIKDDYKYEKKILRVDEKNSGVESDDQAVSPEVNVE